MEMRPSGAALLLAADKISAKMQLRSINTQ
jgi:hypothetical protein